MKEQKIRLTIEWGTIIIIFAIGIYIVVFLQSESNMCIQQPLVYGLKTIIKSNNFDNASCTCQIPSNSSCFCHGENAKGIITFIVNTTSVTPIIPEINMNNNVDKLGYTTIDDLKIIINRSLVNKP